MTTENEVEAHDVAADVPEYPKGELDTMLGKFTYSAHHKDVYFASDLCTINRVEYRVTFHLYFEEDIWQYKSGGNRGYLSIQRKDWTRINNSAGSSAAYDKVRETLIPFLCKWLTANPDLMQKGQRAYLYRVETAIRAQLQQLQEMTLEATADLGSILTYSQQFNRGVSVDWEALQALDSKKRSYY